MHSEAVRIEPGSSLGPYVVERRLAHPGTSALCVARAGNGERVVLKMLSTDAANRPARTRFLRDMQALATVDQRNVVRIDGTGEQDGVAWVAMEYVQGTDLARLMAERGALPVDVALGYVIQAAEGLAAAHGAGLVHGALRPSKLLVAPDGRVVLVDFGTSGHASTAYQSPEQIEHGVSDARSDVWALGCVLYEMLIGTPPFGTGGSTSTSAILRDEPTFPPDVAAATMHVVLSCLRKSSFARLASARDLISIMRDALDRPDASSSHTPSATRISTRPSRPPSIPPSRAPSAARLPALRGRIKGTAVRAGLAWFIDAYGAPAAARVGELASEELRATLRFGDPALGVMPSGWYDTHLVGELLVAMQRAVCPAEPEAFVSRLAEAIARDNVKGVYRSLFKLVASPSLLEANAQRVWRTYLDEGTMAVQLVSAWSFEARVRGWSRHDVTVCRMLRPMLEHLLRAVGYTGLVVDRTECVAEGSSQCTFEGSWLA